MLDLLKHRLKREGLTRLEEAARTESDFKVVTNRWDDIWKRRIKKQNTKELLLSGDMFDRPEYENEIRISKRRKYSSKKQSLKKGGYDKESRVRENVDFIPLMFCCICKMHELSDDPEISRLLNKATNKQKTVFFLRVFRSCSTTKIAQCHDMTDRNVRKLFDLMLDNLRRDLYDALKKRHETNPLSATLRERKFLSIYIPKPPKGKRGRKSKQHKGHEYQEAD